MSGNGLNSNTLRTFYELGGDVIQKGTSYSFRYRVLNIKGWSEFSDIVNVEAADTPSQPDAPVILASSSTELTLEFDLGIVDNNGSPITFYEL